MEQIRSELDDVYGPVPEEVEMLLQVAELRIAASKLEIKSIVTSGQKLIFSFAQATNDKVKQLFSRVSSKVRIVDPRTIHLQLHSNYFEPKTIVSTLRKLLVENKK